jgi:hypothetical protein
VSVALVYLGFLNADEMADRGKPFRSHDEWVEAVRSHGRGIVPDAVWDCDPAPGKGCTVFNGTKYDDHLPAAEVIELVRTLQGQPNSLLAWEAPITGPKCPDGKIDGKQDLTQRPLEAFFQRPNSEYKPPTGISVLPYSGCPHWTITQRVLGLPRVGPYSKEIGMLPLRPLLQEGDQQDVLPKYASVVEVHCAVAVWRWCLAAGRRNKEEWRYKNKKKLNTKRRQALVRLFWTVICRQVPRARDLPRPRTDDQLDAVVAWLLADRWVVGKGVVLLGNSDTGSFLVPEETKLLEGFEEFLRQRCKQKKRPKKPANRS